MRAWPERRIRANLAGAGVAAVAAGFAAMVALAMELSGAQLPAEMWVLGLVGAAAASSMILPGVSGS